MARLEKINSTSWKQPFRDRKKEFCLWGTHTEVAEYCNLQNSEKRLLNIQFETHHEIDVIDRFQITSGREISFPKKFQNLIKPIILGNPESYFIVQVLDIDLDEGEENAIPTTGTATIETRVGQGLFRKNLINHWKGKCAVTGVSLQEVLKASHIKPWSHSSDPERLDKYNGLLLTPTLDALFDKGFITFSEDGFIELSDKIQSSAAALGITDEMKNKKIKIKKNHKKYLEYHRENIFKS